MDIEHLYQANSIMAEIEKLQEKLGLVAIEAKTSPEVLWSYRRDGADTDGEQADREAESLWADDEVRSDSDVGACVNGSPDDGCPACNMRDEKNMELGW